ncbi:MAG: glycosyltransferase family 8 protein [Paracoccus sp. (in: a-proteobacteria)]|nr:glycosyltransferase family 8 protein [Paracoccus sp. (in: a-proteobacteria)]
MHIVTGSDDNYVAGVLVLIASASFHTPGLRVTVLDNGISADNRARIDALGHHLGIPIARIGIDSARFADLPVRRGHLTSSTYLRLLIPDLMPDEERVIYMDCDMVVLDDLTPLSRLDLGDAIVAAVPCPSPNMEELAQMGIARGDYVNAGLLVMNLPVWRRENIAARCIDALSDPDHPLMSEDQSALNLVARGRILPLPARYNVYSDPAAYTDPALVPSDLAVIHYVVRLKPWLGKVPLGAVWWFHAGRIADIMPPPRKTTARQSWSRRMSFLNKRRKLWIGVATGKRKYRILLAAQRKIARLEHALLEQEAARPQA